MKALLDSVTVTVEEIDGEFVASADTGYGEFVTPAHLEPVSEKADNENE